MDREMQIDNLILRLQGRIFEVFATDSDYNLRLHVDSVAFESAPPDRHGRIKARIGRLQKGELSLGSGRVKLEMDQPQFDRFRALVDEVKNVQRAGPEPW